VGNLTGADGYATFQREYTTGTETMHIVRICASCTTSYQCHDIV